LLIPISRCVPHQIEIRRWYIVGNLKESPAVAWPAKILKVLSSHLSPEATMTELFHILMCSVSKGYSYYDISAKKSAAANIALCPGPNPPAPDKPVCRRVYLCPEYASHPMG
jgi:hypothetical protein